MEYYFLDRVSWQHSQGLYHAAAHLGRDVLFVLRPATPYVCLGFHQDAQQEISLEYALEHGIPVFRREVGGGRGLSGRGPVVLPAGDPQRPSPGARE